MSRVEELRDTIVPELTAFYEDAHMDNPAREAALFVDALISFSHSEGAVEGAAMTKVEELRGKIIDMAQGVSFADFPVFLRLLDDYHAEGVAEGEEKERARLCVKEDGSIDIARISQIVFDVLAAEEPQYEIITRGGPYPPVLAPTKEVCEPSNANSATSSGGYWKQVYVPPPEMTFGPAASVLAPTKK